jgi:predicted nucleic acid-binding protein
MISCDTNLIIYAHDNRDLIKQSTAKGVLAALSGRGAVVGLQVVGEVQNALRRRLRTPASVAYRVAADLLAEFGSFAYDERAVEVALAEAGAGRLNYWDALLLAAADAVGVRTMVSEDMADGFRLGQLEVVNPFGAGGASERLRERLTL